MRFEFSRFKRIKEIVVRPFLAVGIVFYVNVDQDMKSNFKQIVRFR